MPDGSHTNPAYALRFLLRILPVFQTLMLSDNRHRGGRRRIEIARDIRGYRALVFMADEHILGSAFCVRKAPNSRV